MGDANTTHAAGALVRIVAEPEIVADGVTVVDADWTCDRVAEAINYAGSKSVDRATWLFGLVTRAHELFDSESKLKFSAALKATDPSRSVRDALDRIMEACGVKNPEDAIAVLQRWGEERATLTRRAKRSEQLIEEYGAKHAAAVADANAMRREVDELKKSLERERASVTILQETFKMAMEKR